MFLSILGWVSANEFKTILRCVVHVLNFVRWDSGSETSSSGFIPMFLAALSSLDVNEAMMFFSVDFERFDGE